MKRPLLLSCVVLLASLGGSSLLAAEPAISIEVLPAIEEVSFPDGYAVYASPDLSTPATKRVPGPTSARVAAYADVPAGRLFLSDWSYERKQKGQSHFWMFVPRPGAQAPAAAPQGITRESVVQCGTQQVAMAKGYTVVDAPHAKAKLLKTVNQGEKLNLAGYLDTTDGLYFITDWSWDRWEKEAKTPNWIRLSDPETAQSLKSILEARKAEAEVEAFATDYEMTGIASTVYAWRQLVKMRDARLPAGHVERLAAIYGLYRAEDACGNATRARTLARRYLDEGKGADVGERLGEIGLLHFYLGNFREADEYWTRQLRKEPTFGQWVDPSREDLVEAKLRAGGSPEDPLIRSYEIELLKKYPSAFTDLERFYQETGHPEAAARLAKEAQVALARLKKSMKAAPSQETASAGALWEMAQAYRAAGDAVACKEVLVLAGSRNWDPRADEDGISRYQQVSPLFGLALMAEREGLGAEQAKLTAAGMAHTWFREDDLEHAGNVEDLYGFLEFAGPLGESETKRAVLDRVVDALGPTRVRAWWPYGDDESLKCDLPVVGRDGPSLAALALANKNYVAECRAIEMRLERLATDLPATKGLTEKLREMKEQWRGGPGDRRDQMDSEADRILGELRAMSGENSRWLRNQVPTLADVQKALGPKAALVDFVRSPVSNYAAVVVTQTGAPVFLDLGEADPINELINRYREIITREPRSPEDAKPLEEISRELYRLLAAPVEKVIASDTTDVILCPDDQLHFLSFAPLLNESGAMWIENRRICYVASARDLARSPSKDISIRSALLIGNPNYLAPGPELAMGRASGSSPAGEQLLAQNDRSGSRADVDGVSLGPLPGTAAEVEQLGKLFAAKQIPVEKWLGAEAYEDRFKRIKGPTILHLATHGFYFDELSRGRTGTLEKEVIASPAERAGLAVSGAQTTIKLWRQGRVPPRGEDGLLMADEAALLNLDGTYLVTLSACETGLGEVLSGGGIAGLKSSLGLAGAENTLLTLWPISDEATVALMCEFYSRLMGGESPARAMAELQRLRLPALRRSAGLVEAVYQVGAFTLSTRAGLR